ncbi:Rap1a/Tai family immunity protein [Ramlibacter sp. MMS24-I3-19]|uniref:Rap1a/Tai family immunity protein n=1 Tax=Ramlibacter sp. MMS24-I3-19 TaxID=3416606 RepID=UPI003D016850
MKKVAATLAACFVAASSQAAPPVIGGDTLLRWLQSNDQRDGSLAIGYIGGVREATFGKEHCASSDAKLPDVIAAVRRVLEGMPKARTMPGSWTVTAALQAKWPCPSSVATAPTQSNAPSAPAHPVPAPSATPAPSPAPAPSTPTRAETESYIVDAVRSCDGSINDASLTGTQLQYDTRQFTYVIDLSRSATTASSSAVYFTCTAPGCISLTYGDKPPAPLNQTTLNCNYAIGARLDRALKHYQSFIGKSKPLF